MASTQNFRNAFLVSLPTLKGDYFHDAVTLLIDHTDHGAFGLVVNRPIDLTIADIFPSVEGHFSCPVLEGGPIRRNEELFFLHEATREFDSTFKVSDAIFMTTSDDFIEAMEDGSAPARTLAVLGYAGWGRGQLEDEIAQNVWLLAPVDPAIVFDLPFPERPQAAARQLGIDLNRISPILGHD